MISLISLALAFLGFVAGYLSTAYGLGFDTGPEQPGDGGRIQIFTPIFIAAISAFVPFWTARFAGGVLSDA